jgi:hypothetical protein
MACSIRAATLICVMGYSFGSDSHCEPTLADKTVQTAACGRRGHANPKNWHIIHAVARKTA